MRYELDLFRIILDCRTRTIVVSKSILVSVTACKGTVKNYSIVD